MRRDSQLTVRPGKVVQRFTPEQVKEYFRMWTAAYPADRNGIDTEAFIWHVFSSERYPSLSLSAALAEYEKHEAAEYLVLANDQDEGLITDQRPSEASVADYIVCPRNWAWTMAMTHEGGWLGPYFARHRNYETLQNANRKAAAQVARKRQETELAKRRGWA